ncbi:MAG TPA: ATP-binding protein, partial [Puia sp.]|nr:ATP-binding protein [Puia sp.]
AGSNEELPTVTRDYFQRILKASTRMQNLISSLLNYSRMNSRGMDFEMTDLNQVLDDASNNIRELLEESRAIIDHEPLPTIPCVPIQINQLFTNLILNSIKYKAAGTPPLVRISARPAQPGEINAPETARDEANYWKIIFSDNGIGFEQQYADRIFELFQRLHSRFEYEGTGIGLAICKKIVQNHKGYIYADGKPGLGASFVIYLPSKR